MRNPPPPPPTTERPRGVAKASPKAKRVGVNLNGPQGTAPHYLNYSVDLPADSLVDADILWMDNGLWMGDEARGSKVLDAPGLHRISVLVITRNNEEYRGAATINVLEKTAGRSAASDSAD